MSPLPSDVPSSSAAPHLSPPPSLAARLSDDPEQALEFQAVSKQARTLQEVVEQFRNEEINAMEAFRAIRDISSNDPVVSQDYVFQIMDIERETNQFKRDKFKGKEAAVSADQNAVFNEDAANEAAWTSMQAQIQDLDDEQAQLDTGASPQGPEPILQAGRDALVRLLSFLVKPAATTDQEKYIGPILSRQLQGDLPNPWFLHLSERYSKDAQGSLGQPRDSRDPGKLSGYQRFGGCPCGIPEIRGKCNLNPVVSLLAAQPFSDPLPVSLLRLIVKDRFVDFDKVYAALVSFSSSTYDDSRDFGSEYKLVFQSVMTHLASFGMRRGVQSPILIIGSMATAVYVGNSTEPLTISPAMTSFRSVAERVESALQGPKSLAGTKHTLDSAQSTSNLRFRPGYLWSSASSSCNIVPPSITSTMTEPPLPSPPEHLLNNPQILATLHSISSYIKVETPFNVDHWELLLFIHPNQPFVASVIRSLREEFWLFYESEWEEKCKQKVENYVTEEVT
ncbi:hypothetical protein F5878DRAFT_664158 [Lentinula raphanica]|uniref:Uncharacterized protein n=1 Tax=Lentinula raphanica TaxID=153919 RepID=A0AA38P2T1_9AGAR|nr:hypothetical protein F5878DRAFT_664158 [Lentinula raphanica]